MEESISSRRYCELSNFIYRYVNSDQSILIPIPELQDSEGILLCAS